VNKAVLRLAIPNILSNLTVPLLGAVDTAVLGHLDSEVYLGAIAMGSIIFNFIYWGLGFLRMGTTGLTAQAHGAENQKESFLVLSRAMLVSLGMGILILLFSIPIEILSFKLLAPSADVEHYAKTYYRIRILGAPAALAVIALNGWFLGMQNARIPMVITIIQNLANIGLNLFFVYRMDMTSDGVAWGTVISNYIAVVLAIFCLFKYFKNHIYIPKWEAITFLPELKKFYLVNRDLFIRTLCLIFVFGFFTAKADQEGNTLLAMNYILLQYMHILSYGIDGFANAAESLVGKFYGAGDPKDLKLSVRASFKWGLGMAFIYMFLFILFKNNMVPLFTSLEDVISAAKPFLIWLILMPLPNSVAFIWDGIFIGLTDSKSMRNSMFVATFLVFLPVYYLAFPYIANHALWLAMLTYMIARAVLLTYLSKRHRI